MSANVKQPVGQKRLTNVAIVRLKKAGQRYEIACYKNKVGDWRSGNEKDLDEVLQTQSVFHNVGKGIIAKDKDLQEAFGTTDGLSICKEILARGELQVSDKERKQDYEHLFKDVAGVLVDKCVDPGTQRPYTLTMLERALRDVHFNVDLRKSAKQQALEVLPLLQTRFPIERARMKLRVSVPVQYTQELKIQLEELEAAFESSDVGSSAASYVVQVDPGAFRELHNFMQAVTQGRGRLEVLSQAVTAEGSSAQEFAGSVASAQPRGNSSTHHFQNHPHSSAQDPPHHAAAATADVGSSGNGVDGTSRSSNGAHDIISSGNGHHSAQHVAVQQQHQRHGSTEAAKTGTAVAAHGSSSSSNGHTENASSGSGRHSKGSGAGGQAKAGAGVAGDGRASATAVAVSGTPGVLYRGSIQDLPEAHASRKERFLELESLQPGWQVELRVKGDAVEAVFFSPQGVQVGAYANARRMALQASKLAAA